MTWLQKLKARLDSTDCCDELVALVEAADGVNEMLKVTPVGYQKDPLKGYALYKAVKALQKKVEGEVG